MLTRSVTWVGALEVLRGAADLGGLGPLQASVTTNDVDIAPQWVWDPSTTGLPTRFGTRTNAEYAGALSVATGYLDGHNWVLDEDLTVFTSDIPSPSDLPALPDVVPNLETDRDTLILRRAGQHTLWVEPRGTAEFADGIVAVSAEPSNWGAFLLRVLPKLADAARLDVPVLAYLGHPNQRLLAELAGIRTSNLVAHDPRLRYELRNVRLPLVPTSALWVSPRLKATYRDLAEKARGQHPGASASPRLYLSRRGSTGRRSSRQLVNEAELEAALEGRGFQIVRPEDLPSPQVAAIVSQAKVIVTVGGAGMFNTVFAAADAVVIDIEGQPTWLPGHTNVLTGVARRWGLFYGYPADPSDPRVHRPFAIDVAALLRAIDDVEA